MSGQKKEKEKDSGFGFSDIFYFRSYCVFYETLAQRIYKCVYLYYKYFIGNENVFARCFHLNFIFENRGRSGHSILR